jgi:hypothetical protein
MPTPSSPRRSTPGRARSRAERDGCRVRESRAAYRRGVRRTPSTQHRLRRVAGLVQEGDVLDADARALNTGTPSAYTLPLHDVRVGGGGRRGAVALTAYLYAYTSKRALLLTRVVRLWIVAGVGATRQAPCSSCPSRAWRRDRVTFHGGSLVPRFRSVASRACRAPVGLHNARHQRRHAAPPAACCLLNSAATRRMRVRGLRRESSFLWSRRSCKRPGGRT